MTNNCSETTVMETVVLASLFLTLGRYLLTRWVEKYQAKRDSIIHLPQVAQKVYKSIANYYEI